MDPSEPQRDRARRLLRVGVVLLVLWLGAYTALAVGWPDPYAQAWQLVVGQFIAGQPFAASLGQHLGFAGWFVVAQGVAQGVVVLMLLFPLLLLGEERSRQLRFLAKPVARVRRLADRFHARLGRYGTVALLVFLVFPLWNTGPGALSVAGALLGLSTPVLLLTLVLGNTVCLTLWVVAFDTLEALLVATGMEQLPLPMPVLVLIVVVVVAGIKRGIGALRRSSGNTG